MKPRDSNPNLLIVFQDIQNGGVLPSIKKAKLNQTESIGHNKSNRGVFGIAVWNAIQLIINVTP